MIIPGKDCVTFSHLGRVPIDPAPKKLSSLTMLHILELVEGL
jgi:hypothetical protein